MIPFRKIACKECPYRRSSIPGFTSERRSRWGLYEAFTGLLAAVQNKSPNQCHTEQRRKRFWNPDKPKTAPRFCAGYAKFQQGGDKKFFSNLDELQAHHVFKEGPCNTWMNEIGKK